MSDELSDADLDMIRKHVEWNRLGQMRYPDDWYTEDVPRLLAEVQRLRELAKFADHLDWCQCNQYISAPCDCGYAKVEPIAVR